MKARMDRRWVVAGSGVGIVLAVFVLFSPSIGFDFINLDDTQYIVENPMVSGGLSWESIWTAWTTSLESYWAPGLWMSFMLDADLYGLNPHGFHLGNVILFSLNVGLLFGLAWRWTGRIGVAAAAALLWGFHPERVESVAWVVERKDVLSGLFFLLGIGAYVEGRQGRLRHGMFWAWMCMALGGTVKQVVIVMPAVMVLLDVWPLGRTDWGRLLRDGARLVLEKWAFWGLALILAVLPIWFHLQDNRLIEVSMRHRLGMIPIHYLFYFQKMLWPSGLAVLQGDLFFRWGDFLLGTSILFGATVGLWRCRKEMPWALWGWLWYVGAQFPLIGLVWGGAERLATRFQYIPQMGLMLTAVLAVDQMIHRRGWNWRVGAVACLLVLSGWGVMTWRLLPFWKNSLAINMRVLRVNPNSVHGFDNLGQAFFVQGKPQGWQAFLEATLREQPGNPLAGIHYAWWMAAMIGDAESSQKTLEKTTGLSRNEPGFWTWLDGKTESQKLLGTWRDTAGICLRQAGNVEQMEVLRASWEGQWDDRTRQNFLAELRHAQWKADSGTDSGGAAAASQGDLCRPFLERWAQGARGYAAICFVDYATRYPDDGRALNNMAWLLATARPDGLRYAGEENWPALAVEWAERSLAQSGGLLPGVWDTLAAARAHAQDFEGAVTAAEKGLALATASGDGTMAEKMRNRLERYREGCPWRE